MPSATGSVGRSHVAAAATLAASAPYRATSDSGNPAPDPGAGPGFAGAPISGRLRVRHFAARRCRSVMARFSTSSAM
ncbi:Uncharacterised protein [Mycobacterium tuberculosis]|nr:Uncharacterised protein [Mycobacterium tuberculosis]SGE02899.1 Uncharacterised protein [Mycobacterium tuberculosis]SGE56135.1 Uncharacterised protein [Mycobacterium tuberculosis]SGG59122.1 Uncharacterised protein [Mycobacterium tuberculosis]SGG61452.1 Uncharacterised protein [Mycobacterium tuberculosis]